MIELLVGAGLSAFGLGSLIASRRKRPLPNAPICPCSHSIGEHKNRAGRCAGQIVRPHYLSTGGRNGKEWVACVCMHYSGPELISSFTMRGIE